MEKLKKLCESHPEVELSSDYQAQCTSAKRSSSSGRCSNGGSSSGPASKRKKVSDYITKILK